jgi:hypothetical protein
VNQCNPTRYPKNTRLACISGTNKTNPFYFCLGVQGPVQTWTLNLHTWDPISVRCLNLHLSPPPISRSGKSRNLWQESNEPSRSHKQVCARDNKSVTWLPSTVTDSLQSTRTGKWCNQAKPRGRGTRLVTPTNNPFLILTRSPFSFYLFIMRVIIIFTCLWVTTGYPRYR